MARRYDYLRLDASNLRRTPQGGIAVPAALTRTGIFVYRKADGSTIRELRHPEEVFQADSLASLAHAPLTIGHVAQINPDNWQKHSVGHVAGEAKQDGRLVTAEVRIQHGDAVKQVESGDLKELSCGYDVELDPTPGMWNGERYDAVQRKPRYNHVALLPEGSGRAGPEVSLRTDSAFTLLEDTAHADDKAAPPPAAVPPPARADEAVYPGGMPTELEVKLQKENDDLKSRIDALDKAAATDEVKGQIAAIEAERRYACRSESTRLPAEIEAAVQPKRADTPRAGRSPHAESLEGRRQGQSGHQAGGSRRPSRRTCKLDGKSDDAVRGAFEQAVVARRLGARRSASRVSRSSAAVTEDGSSMDDDEPKAFGAEQRMKDRKQGRLEDACSCGP